MFDLSFGKLILLMAVALIVLGPEKLFETLKVIMQLIKIIKSNIAAAKQEIEKELNASSFDDLSDVKDVINDIFDEQNVKNKADAKNQHSVDKKNHD